MIIIIAPYPDPNQPKDGFLARISYIDDIFKDQEKIYIWFDSTLKTVKPLGGQVEKNIQRYYVNHYNPIHILYILKFALKADYCYFHSVYHTFKFFYLLLLKKCIIDLHGLIVEEGEMMGNYSSIPHYKRLEKFAITHAYKVVSVTETMADFIQSKYPKKKIDFIILPIFDNKKRLKSKKKISQLYNQDKQPVIYSGTASVWQAVDKIVSLIKNSYTKYRYTILTPDKDTFEEKLRKSKNNIEIRSVKKEEVYDYYDKSLYGIVIRENNIVNTVSCPTKLIEYMATNVLPVVEYTSIGDFEKLGYKYILSQDLEKGKLPSIQDLTQMLDKNIEVVEKLQKQTELGTIKLQEILDK